MSCYSNFSWAGRCIGAFQNDTCFQLVYQFRCQIAEKGEFISFFFVIGRMSELLIEDTVIRDQEKSGRLTVKASDRRKPVILQFFKIVHNRRIAVIASGSDTAERFVKHVVVRHCCDSFIGSFQSCSGENLCVKHTTEKGINDCLLTKFINYDIFF